MTFDRVRSLRAGCAAVRAILRGTVATAIALLAFELSSKVLAQPTIAHPTAATREGAELYALHCSSCHGTRFEGSENAPPLLKAGAARVDFWLGTGRMPAILPADVEAEHQRPQFAQPQIDALVAYISAASPGGPAIPRVGFIFANNDLAHGRELFAENCQACHGAMAQGGSVGYGVVAPDLYRATVIQVAEAIRTGPGVMPRFGAATFSQTDLDALVHYVNVLQTQRADPGGFNLANIGPVAEGLVGWVLGLGVLLGIARFIGTTT